MIGTARNLLLVEQQWLVGALGADKDLQIAPAADGDAGRFCIRAVTVALDRCDRQQQWHLRAANHAVVRSPAGDRPLWPSADLPAMQSVVTAAAVALRRGLLGVGKVQDRLGRQNAGRRYVELLAFTADRRRSNRLSGIVAAPAK